MPKEAAAKTMAEQVQEQGHFWAGEVMQMYFDRRPMDAPFGTSQLGFLSGLAMTLGCCIRASANLDIEHGGAAGGGEALLRTMLDLTSEAFADNPMGMEFEVIQ